MGTAARASGSANHEHMMAQDAVEDWCYGELRVEIMQQQKIRVKLDPDNPAKTTPVSMYGFRIGNKPPNTVSARITPNVKRDRAKGEQISFHLDAKEDRLTWATFLRTGRKRAALRRHQAQLKFNELRRNVERFANDYSGRSNKPYSQHSHKAMGSRKSRLDGQKKGSLKARGEGSHR